MKFFLIHTNTGRPKLHCGPMDNHQHHTSNPICLIPYTIVIKLLVYTQKIMAKTSLSQKHPDQTTFLHTY